MRDWGLWWSASLSCRFESLFIHWESAREDQKLSKCARDTQTSGTVLGHRTQCFRWCCFITTQLRSRAKLVKVGSQIGPDELVLTETHHFGVKHHWTKKKINNWRQVLGRLRKFQLAEKFLRPDDRMSNKQNRNGDEKKIGKEFFGRTDTNSEEEIFLRIHFFRHEPITIRPPIKILKH